MKDGRGYHLDYDRPKSIGRVRNFFGSVGVLVRMYCYIRIARAGRAAANRRRRGAECELPARAGEGHAAGAARRPLHARVRGLGRGAEEPDAAFRRWTSPSGCLDYGFHAPTVYFPLIVHEAMMIEPTESESKATLDAFAEVLAQIVEESPESLHDAPHSTPICRPDEVTAARKPVLRWKEEGLGARG